MGVRTGEAGHPYLLGLRKMPRIEPASASHAKERQMHSVKAWLPSFFDEACQLRPLRPQSATPHQLI